jgi:hypothetical protein
MYLGPVGPHLSCPFPPLFQIVWTPILHFSMGKLFCKISITTLLNGAYEMHDKTVSELTAVLAPANPSPHVRENRLDFKLELILLDTNPGEENAYVRGFHHSALQCRGRAI